MSLPIQIGTVPGGFCPSTYQDLFNILTTIGSVNINSGTSATVVISSSKPADTTVVWKRIDSLGRYLGDYIYGQGAWLRAHPLQPGTTIWWFQALPNFTTFDGGDGGTLGIQSGPMWQQALDVNNNLIAAQFPIAAGTLASGTVLSNGSSGGEEKHVLVDTEQTVGSLHKHPMGYMSGSANFVLESGGSPNAGTPGFNANPNTASSSSSISDITTYSASGKTPVQTDLPSPSGTATGHNNMPPYITGFLLQRTSRQFYAVT